MQFNILKQVDESILKDKIEDYKNRYTIVKDFEGNPCFIPNKKKPEYIIMSYATQCALNRCKAENFTFLPPSCKNACFCGIPILTYNQLQLGEVILI